MRSPHVEVITKPLCTFPNHTQPLQPQTSLHPPGQSPLNPAEEPFGIGPGSQRKTDQRRLRERGVLLGPFCVLSWARATEQPCKDGSSVAAGMEPAGTCPLPAPAGSRLVTDAGEEPGPDLCPGVRFT